MWLHELGHATTAWMSGFWAFPGPWRTAIGESRAPAITVVLLGALAGLGVWAYRAGKRPAAAALGALVVLQLVLTLGVKTRAAQALILFGGDAGGMVLGAALFATFFAPPGSRLHTTWLRWGFLFLGAFGFADPFALWWRARHDLDVIPFGEIEGVGHSDPSRLVDVHGWSVPALISRYVTLGVVCLVVMAAAYAWGLTRGAARSADRPGSPAPPG
jgi:hypothetical protein